MHRRTFRGLRRLFGAATVASVLLCAAAASAAGIAEIVNTTDSAVRLTIIRDGAAPRRQTLAAGGRTLVSTAKRATVSVDGAPASLLAANARYEVRLAAGAVALMRTGDRQTTRRQPRVRQPRREHPDQENVRPVTIKVKILADDDQPLARPVWEARYKNRIEEVSAILEKAVNVRLQVVAVDVWDSDDSNGDFAQSLGELEKEVELGDAQLAVGFTSQRSLLVGRTHMGGTRGPLHTHILLREWTNAVAEPERIELLLHETAHTLGAVHSGDPNSVMRPVLGDRKSLAADFAITIDEPNLAAMKIFVDELRSGHVRRLADVSSESLARLKAHYAAMVQKNPKDPAAAHYLNLLLRATQAKRPAAGEMR